jgi:tetratricopeptide (TPR) repeat protein
MQRAFLSAVLFCLVATTYAQNPQADSLLSAMRKAEGPAARFPLMYKLLYEVPLLTQQQRIDCSKAILDMAKQQGDKVMESVAMAELGDLLAYNGDRLQGTELAYAALEMGQEHGNEQALALILVDLSRCMEERSKAMAHLHTALDLAKRSGDHNCTMWCYSNLSGRHIEAKQRDSALYYAQRMYDISLTANLEVGLASSYGTLAGIQYELYGEKGIAYEYLKKARASFIGRTHPEHFMGIHGQLAKCLLKDGQVDSALYYTDLMRTKQAYGAPGSVLAMYALYKDIYADRNSDSALKYFRL